MTRRTACVMGFLLVAALPVSAAIIDVEVTGTVSYNMISLPPLGDFDAGAPATLTFTVDSTNFIDSVNFPTRGYPIDTSSFVLSSGSASIGLQNPFPPGVTPYFALRNNDPAVDGFFVSTDYEFSVGVPLNQTHTTGARYNQNFHVTYTGDTLSSLDILDAVGAYDYTGLTVFNWTIWRNFPENVGMEMEFAQLSIIPEPNSLAVLGVLALLSLIRRR